MTEDNILAAIRERPYEHAPRLVYADWLEEHGNSKRANIIRSQFTGGTPMMVLVVNPWDFVCFGEDGIEVACADWYEAFVNFRHLARFRSPGLPRFQTAFKAKDTFVEAREIGVRDRRGHTVIGRARVTLATPHPKKWYTVEITPVTGCA